MSADLTDAEMGTLLSAVFHALGTHALSGHMDELERRLRLAVARIKAQARAEGAREALLAAAEEMHFGVARGALITERAECHKKQCACGHPSEDRLLALVADRFRGALRARAATHPTTDERSDR